jgi:hypothetical protein
MLKADPEALLDHADHEDEPELSLAEKARRILGEHGESDPRL